MVSLSPGSAEPMTIAEHCDLVSRLLIELLEVVPEEKHDHLQQIARAIDALAGAALTRSLGDEIHTAELYLWQSEQEDMWLVIGRGGQAWEGN